MGSNHPPTIKSLKKNVYEIINSLDFHNIVQLIILLEKLILWPIILLNCLLFVFMRERSTSFPIFVLYLKSLNFFFFFLIIWQLQTTMQSKEFEPWIAWQETKLCTKYATRLLPQRWPWWVLFLVFLLLLLVSLMLSIFDLPSKLKKKKLIDHLSFIFYFWFLQFTQLENLLLLNYRCEIRIYLHQKLISVLK